MHSQYAQSNQDNQYPDSYQNEQQTIFQKYSKLSSNQQNSPGYNQDIHFQSDHYFDQEQPTPIAQTKVIQSNIQVMSQDHENKSLIQSVAKEQSFNQSQSNNQNGNGLAGVPEASSKIIHQPVSNNQFNQFVQYNQQQQIQSNNRNIIQQQEQIANSSSNFTQNQQNLQQNNLRHTVGAIQSSNYQVSNQKNLNQPVNIRSSLPANTSLQQYKTAPSQAQYTSISQQHNTFGQQPHYMPVQQTRQNTVQQVHSFNSQFQQQQSVRVPQHVPQSLLPVQKIQSQTLVQPINFIKNGPQRLQTSEIVYKNRNPNIINMNQPIQNQFFGTNQQQIYQRGNNNSQPQRVHSFDIIRANTRSLERRQTNVVFNYNTQGNTQNIVSKQSQFVSQPPNQVIQQRPASVSPVPLSMNPTHTVGKPVTVQQIVQPVQPIKPIPIQPQLSQVQAQHTFEQYNQWKQRYFAFYTKFESVNKKVEFITEQFHIYEKLIQSVKQQKTIKRHLNFTKIIQQLQQQCVSITHQWKPTGQIKLPSTQPSKQIAHLQMKYKRLLFNFSKVQQQNQTIKKTLQQKIHQVVKKLQVQNSDLKTKLAQIKVPQVVQSDDLTLSASLKFELEESIARYYQQNRSLQDQVQRLSQKNEELIQRINHLQNQPVTVVQTQDQKTIGMESIEHIIQELNIKLREYQVKLTTFQDQNQRLDEKNQQLQHYIQNQQRHYQSIQVNSSTNSNNVHLEQQLNMRIRQIEQIQANYESLEQGNFMLANQLQRLTARVNQVEGQLQQAQYQLRNQPQQNTIVQQTHASSQQIEELNRINQQIRIQLQQKTKQSQKLKNQITRSEQRNTYFRQQLGKMNMKVINLQKQLQQAQQHLLKQPIQLIQSNSDQHQLSQQIQQRLKQYQHLQIQNAKIYQQNVSLRDQLQRLNQKIKNLQKQLTESQTHINEYHTQINQYQNQLLRYQNQIHELQNQSTTTVQSASQSPLLIQQYEFTIATLRSQINRKQSEIQRQSRLSDQRILDLTEQLKLSYKERQSLHKKFQQKTLLLEGERQKKEILIRQLRDKIYELEQKRRLQDTDQNRRNDYMNKMSAMSQAKQISKLNAQIQNLKTQKDRAAKDSQLQSKRLSDQVQQLTQDNSRLKKQISQFSSTVNELESMTQVLSKKNMQILQLKNISFENQKLMIENTNLKRQIDRQSQQNTRLSIQYEKVCKINAQISRNIKQVEQNLNGLNNKFISLQGQYKLLVETNDRKDQQISRFKQSTKSLQQNLQSAQKQNEKVNFRLRNLQITFEQQTTALKQQIQNFKAKLSDYDNLIRQKSISDHKITQLESYKQKYEYQLKQNEQLITKQKSKIKILQSEKQDLTQQIDSVNDKIKQQEKKSSQATKKYKKAVQDLQQKNKSLQQKQVRFEKQKISDLETDIKTKQNKIWKLQKQLQQVLQRLDQVGDQQINSQKLIFLEQKVKQYEARLFNQTFKYGPTNYDYQATKVFERQVIYQLKQQNQKLKQFVTQKKTIKPTNDKNLALSKAQVQIKQAYDQELDQVQLRLAAFNTKLQNLIVNGSYQNIQFPHKKTKKSPIKIQTSNVDSSTMRYFDSQNSTKQLRQIKLKYSELERYCKNIEVELLSGKSQKTLTQSNVFVTSTNQSIANDQVTFHKQKNRQLQERVDKLLKMNTQLKQNLENLLKQRNDSSSLSYYKEQITELNEKIIVYEQRVKKLLEQNERLKSQFGQFSKGEQNIQVKVFEYERKVIELQRIINQINLARSSLQNELQSKNQLIQTKQYEINELRNQLSMSGQKESVTVTALRQKIDNYEAQLTKLTNKLRINESQIQRLNESIKKKQAESGQQVGRWRIKVNQLQQQLTRIGQQRQGQKSGQSSLKMQISRLSQQMKSIQYENNEIKQVNENLLRRLQQSQIRYKQIKNSYQELQNELSSRRIQEQQWGMRFEQQQAEYTKLRNQCEILKHEIQRLNEQAKNKQRNYQIEINSLHQKLGLTEREQLNYKKSSSSWQSQRKSYEVEINKYKLQISQLNASLQQINKNNINKQRMYQDKISMLKSQITQIQSTSMGLQQNTNQLTLLKQRYQGQIAEMRNQISILKSQIQRLNGILRQKDSLYQSIQANCVLLNEHKQGYQIQISRLVNQSNIMRDQIQRLKFSIVQKDSLIVSLRSGVESVSMQKDTYDRQLASSLNQISILRQQNERLKQQIVSIKQQTNKQINNSLIEINRLRRQVQELRMIINEYKESLINKQRQFGIIINENNELKHQNSKLMMKIEQLESTYLQSMKISPIEFEQIKRENSELRYELSEVNNRVMMMRQNVVGLGYYIELSRSIYLQVQALLDHKLLSTVQQTVSINQTISQSLQKGLYVIIQINKLLRLIV